MTWVETYRGIVNRWEVDNVDHFTVAFYFTRIQDATAALLDSLGLGEPAAGSGLTLRIDRCDVRYLRELRMADLLHVRSGVVGVDETGVSLAHELYDSGDGTLCTTVEQHAHVVGPGGVPRALPSAQREAVQARWVSWEPPAARTAAPPMPAGDAGFMESARDTIKPWEVDAHGDAAWPAYVHRFSAANGHLLAAFGLTPAYMREERRGFSTFEFRLGFPGAVRAGTHVVVRSALVHLGSTSMRIVHRLADARTGAVAATLEQAGVQLDLDARRPTPLSDDMRDRARRLLVP